MSARITFVSIQQQLSLYLSLNCNYMMRNYTIQQKPLSRFLV